jgi:ubiquinol-cytochrome c reductase cytochrome c subunit
MNIPIFIAAAALLGAAAPAFAADAPAGDPKAGLKTFISVGCYQCHGVQGQGGGKSGPRLAPGPLPRDAIERQLRAPRDRMPIYTAEVLSDSQMNDIIAYLNTIPAAKPASTIPLLNIQ